MSRPTLVSDEVVNAVRDRDKMVKMAKSKLTPELEGVVAHEAALYAKEATGGLQFFWERGEVVNNVSQNRSIDGRSVVDYGENAVELLAQALGMSTSRIYRVKSFFQLYTQEEVTELVNRVREANYELGWGHVQEVLSIQDNKGKNANKLRKDMIEVAIASKLSVRAIRAEVLARFGQKPEAKTTRPKAAAKKMCLYADKFIERFDEYLGSVFAATDDAPGEDDLEQVRVRLQSVEERLHSAIERVNTKLIAKNSPSRRSRATAGAVA